LSAYIVEPPDILQIDLLHPDLEKRFPVRGTHLVRPDGSIGLGAYGSVFVAGLTLDQIRVQIAQRVAEVVFEKNREEKARDLLTGLKVDVAAYNSKFFYVITDGGGYGEQVYRVLTTGNETVLDAIAQIAGLPAVASKKQIWIARATPVHSHGPNILPVDWCGITKRGEAATNYQIYPGDRIYVNSDSRIRLDTHLAKFFSPIERILGITLLGSTTVNSIKNSNTGGGGTSR
jgi:polysaccharide export outer membrane protein